MKINNNTKIKINADEKHSYKYNRYKYDKRAIAKRERGTEGCAQSEFRHPEYPLGTANPPTLGGEAAAVSILGFKVAAQKREQC